MFTLKSFFFIFVQICSSTSSLVPRIGQTAWASRYRNMEGREVSGVGAYYSEEADRTALLPSQISCFQGKLFGLVWGFYTDGQSKGKYTLKLKKTKQYR